MMGGRMQYCHECGTELEGGERYCPNCGTNLDAEDERDTGSGPTAERDVDDTDPVEVAKSNSLFGTLVSVVAYAGAVIGAIGPWTRYCSESVTESSFGGSIEICQSYGTYGGGAVTAVPIVISVVMLTLLLDDYYDFGLIETWRPRKVRLNFLAGLALIAAVLIRTAGESLAWGAKLIVGASLLLLLFSALVSFLKWGFEKHIGFR